MFKFVFSHSTGCLDVEGQSKKVGSSAHQWDCLDIPSQKFYVKKFSDVELARLRGENFNRTVWTFWDKGKEKLPAFNQYNINHWRRILPESYKIRVINLVEGDPDNVITILGGKQLLPKNWEELDDVVRTYIGPDGNFVKMVPAVVKSDFIRLALLEKFGGIWMDSSNVLLKNLDEIIINQLEGSNFSVAGYIMDGYASKSSVKVHDKFVDGMENWFIAAKKNSQLIYEWRKAFIKYWETKTPGQFIHQHPMYDRDGFDFGGLGQAAPNYLNQHAALKYVLFHNPSLGKKILPFPNLNPWWLHSKVGGGADELYRGIIRDDIEDLARQIREESDVSLLKFAGPHLTEIKKAFPKIDDWCQKDNLIKLLYGECP